MRLRNLMSHRDQPRSSLLIKQNGRCFPATASEIALGSAMNRRLVVLVSAVTCSVMTIAFALFGCVVAAAAGADESPRSQAAVEERALRTSSPGKFTPVERMAPARLKATHDDLERIRKTRRVLAALPGLRDYRAILHAHAEDSDHTGGTRAEMLSEAKKAGVDVILLTDHHRPPRDFMSDSWRGLRDGVLFVPGSEAAGFLLYPARSIMTHMNDPTAALIEATRADGGLIFLSHIEERPSHSMAGLDGMEIYNRHADAKNDAAGVVALMAKLTAPGSLKELKDNLTSFPDEFFAAQMEYPALYLAKWDKETRTRRLTGVAANDCHHNFVLLVKMVDHETVKVGTNVDPDARMRSISARLRPSIRDLTYGHRPGDVLARIDLDPFSRSFRNVSTHIIAPELSEAAVRDALRAGHAYVSHDWMCDPSGFRFELVSFGEPEKVVSTYTERLANMGDERKLTKRMRLLAEFPVRCHIRLLEGGKLVAEQSGDRLRYDVSLPGVYRVEGWLESGGEERGWVYSNPIYIR